MPLPDGLEAVDVRGPAGGGQCAEQMGHAFEFVQLVRREGDKVFDPGADHFDQPLVAEQDRRALDLPGLDGELVPPGGDQFLTDGVDPPLAELRVVGERLEAGRLGRVSRSMR